MPENRLNIHVIADSSGESAARIARAAKAQFPKLTIDIISHPRIKDAEKAIAAFREIAKSSETNPDLPIVVLYTFVNPEMRALIKQLCEENQLQHADLLGDTLAAMANATGRTADGVPMRPVLAEADYFDRISAMEFAVRNDDGVMPSAIAEADIVLVGASRSGKTPLSLYLGYVGYKTVNVPLVPSIEPPAQLREIDRWRIVGLTIDAERLLEIRSRRVKGLGGYGTKDGGYADLAKIYDELDEVGRIQRSLGCPIVDTTGLAIEDAAARIVDIVDNRANKAGTALRRPPTKTLKIKP